MSPLSFDERPTATPDHLHFMLSGAAIGIDDIIFELPGPKKPSIINIMV